MSIKEFIIHKQIDGTYSGGGGVVQGVQDPATELAESVSMGGDAPLIISNNNIFEGADAIYNFATAEPLIDSSGNDRTLTEVGSLTFGEFGGKTQSAFTNSTSNYLQRDELATTVAGRDLAVSLWFNTSSDADLVPLYTFEEKDSGSSNAVIWIRTNGLLNSDGRLQFRINNIVAFKTQQENFDDGEWHHLVANFLSTGNSVYIDGVPQNLLYDFGNASSDSRYRSGLDRFFIGRKELGGAVAYNGYLANMVFTQTEITAQQALNIWKGVRFVNNKLTIPELSTQSLIVNDGNQTSGYVLTCLDPEGRSEWQPALTPSPTNAVVNITNFAGELEDSDFTPGSSSYIRGWSLQSLGANNLSLEFFLNVALTAGQQYFMQFDSPGAFNLASGDFPASAPYNYGVVTVVNDSDTTTTGSGRVIIGDQGGYFMNIRFQATDSAANGLDRVYMNCNYGK